MSPSEQARGAGEEARHPCENVNRWRSLFLRMQKRGVLPSCTGGSWSPDRGTGLYGRPLLSVCGHDRRLPRPIREVLAELWSRAPATEGVFRKPGNAKRLSEIKARLEAGEDLDAEAQPVVLLAALLKDFLRQLPDGLLGAPLYPAWMSAMEKEEAQRCSELRQVSDRLPKANVHLLQCLLLVLQHISRSADTNKMDARNLAVCVSPNLLPVEHLSLDTVEKVTALTQFLIENCGEIFGDGPQAPAADPAEEDRLADSTDSLSSHGQDSAYDSADPEAEADPAADRPPSPAAAEEMAAATPVATPSRRPSCGASRRPGRPVCRRRSEPAMLRSAGMRTLLSLARGDEGDRPARPLAKQASHDSFLLPGRGPAAAPPPPLPLNSDSSPRSDSSPCTGSSPRSDSSPCTGFSPLAESSPCDASGDRTLVLSSSALTPKSRPQGYNVPTPGGGVKRRSRSVRREDRRTTPSHRASQ